MALPIVGARFRPPALAILRVLPTDCPLEARPEPDNPHDPNAIAIWVKSCDIPLEAHDELQLHAMGFGCSAAQVYGSPSHHLGYIPAKIAAAIISKFSGPEAGTLSFSMKGSPQISLPFGEEFSEL